MHSTVSLGYLFWSFLKIGSTAFGGFMALISVVENIFVKRDQHIRHEDMLDGISLASMLPGPIAVNVVAYVGYRLRGYTGAAVSAIAVTIPSFVLIVGLTIVYLRWGQLPTMNSIFQGFIPAVCAIIAATAWNLGRKAVVSWREGVIMGVAVAAILFQGGFLVTLAIIAMGAVAGIALFYRKQRPPAAEKDNPSGPGDDPGDDPAPPSESKVYGFNFLALAPLVAVSGSMVGKLFLTFATMSLVLFGGGYVFIPLIQESVVNGYGWVTQREFIDAIAMGQVTPGPILISAAFIGYKMAALPGALSATIGIFMPSIMLMIFCSNIFQRVKSFSLFQSALRGIRPAVIGMIAAAVVVVGQTAPVHWLSPVVFGAALLALLKYRLPIVWIIPSSGVLGFIFL